MSASRKCDRSGIEAALGGMLARLVGNARGLLPFAEKYAEELCLDFLGEQEKGPGEAYFACWSPGKKKDYLDPSTMLNTRFSPWKILLSMSILT